MKGGGVIMGRKLDLIGQRFNRLLVLEEVEKNKWGKIGWKCCCDCGTEKIVLGDSLRSGHTESCGCLRKEVLIKQNKQKTLNLVGQRFGRLVVLKKVGNIKWLSWLCLCSCGNKTIVSTGNLNSGSIKSCGCLQKERKPMLIGQRFGRLIVVKEVGRNKYKKILWFCKCDCGNETIVLTGNLKSGSTQSCGCLQKEYMSKSASQRCGFLSPSWKGGISFEPYCFEWTNDLKEFIKQRDGYKCMNPCCNSKDPDDLCVHHFAYDKKSCGPEDLITVCRSCNASANYNREWHTAWYQAIMYMRYGYEYEL